MTTALDRLAPHLDRLSDGETGDRSLWVAPAMEKFRADPDVELVHDGDWSDYDRVAQWRVRDGATLDPGNIRLHYALAFENSYPSFVVLRERYARPDLRFQVGIPAPLDLAVYSFGEVAFADATIMDACTAATAREIETIFVRAGDDVVFQLETVVGLVAIAQAQGDEQPAVAARMAATLHDLAARVPAGARFGAHLCLGDFHHKAYGPMHDARPLVLLANALAAGWPDGRTLDYVHAPFAAASEPPIADERFYAPLAELDLPAATRFIAGFIHESLDLDAHGALLERIERLAGREVDVAAACGLGRRPEPDQAWDAMSKAVALVTSARPPRAGLVHNGAAS
jgi:hypothetical protein